MKLLFFLFAFAEMNHNLGGIECKVKGIVPNIRPNILPKCYFNRVKDNWLKALATSTKDGYNSFSDSDP